MARMRSQIRARLPGFLGAVILTVALLILSLAPAQAEDRVALVIGNSAYRDLLALDNPYNDARDVAAALWEAGFETIELIDATREDMLAGIATFAKRLEDGTDAVFYYAGHGVQSHGANFLLPVDTRVEHAGHLAEFGIDANEIALLMAGTRARINVLILDACRDNPFVGSGSRLAEDLRQIDQQLITASPATEVVVRSTGGGLAPMHASRAETIVGYSTGPGEVALDGEHDNSPYTAALLEHINTPGLEIDGMFRRVRATVRETTNGIQIPWVASTLENEFYIRPVFEVAATDLDEAMGVRVEDTRKLGMAPPDRLIEEAFWQIATSTAGGPDLAFYLERYPEGRFADDAQALLANGEQTMATAQSAAATGAVRQAFLGVGPIALDLDEEIAALRGAVAYEVTQVPTSGTFFRRDDTPVRSDHLLSAEDVRELRFLPMVGTRIVGVIEHLELRQVGAADDAEPLRIAVSAELHPCDLLAGFRYAPDRVWDGVQQAILNLDPLPAVEACQQAVTRFPEIDRFAALLSRAHRSAGQFEQARRWAKEAVERGYPPGYSQLGTIYMRGDGVAADFDKALELLELGYEHGNPASPLRIGQMYEAGWGVEQDYAQAHHWYRQSMALGNAYAQTRLAALYANGLGVEQDLAAAVELYRGAAAAGELTAQIRLSRMYRDGIGVERDLDEALSWARAAAGAGMPEGQKALGQFYTAAPDPDVIAAVHWFERADANGDPWAPKYLGELYRDADLLGPDIGMAESFFQRAVERGNTDAARDIARLRQSDPVEAARWHRIAAEAGNIWSMRDIGRALIGGEGVERNADDGFAWLRRAADGGNPWAQRDVGRAFLDGDLVAPDSVEAARYLGLAAGSDDAGSVESATRLLESLSERDRLVAVQTFLQELGFDAGAADGIAGPATLGAIDNAAAVHGFAVASSASIEVVAALATASHSNLTGRTVTVSQQAFDGD